MNLRKIAIVLAGAGLLCLMAAEVGLRIVGVIDFPLYAAGPPYGYIPAPRQQGAFLNKNDWAFNERSMGIAAPFRPSMTRVDTLLIGDSIVYGGNPYRQAQKLGPQLEVLSGDAVWPIGAGSWALLNELTYLRRNPDVVTGADRLVFVLNSADFVAPSTWCTDQTHPRHRPLLAIAYVLDKLAASAGLRKTCPAASATDAWVSAWSQMLETSRVPVFVFLYPDASQARTPTATIEEFERFRIVTAGRAKIVEVARRSEWRPNFYRDPIHPTPEGMAALARIIRADTAGAAAD